MIKTPPSVSKEGKWKISAWGSRVFLLL